VPGAGTIVNLEQYGAPFPFSFATLNDRGQVAFVATVSDGTTTRTALLLGSPQR
jgi:hypothetical protein